MKLIETIEFPSKYLDCYESVLITILKYMGLSNDAFLLGTQAYFYFSMNQTSVKILPRFNQIHEEWQRVFAFSVKSMSIENESSLKDELISKLNNNMPVCLPIDLFYLPYTPHYQRLHQTHFINIFGYEHERYYVVCPYYRFIGWVDANYINTGFFTLGKYSQNIVFIPTLELKNLTAERVRSLAQESCQNMLGLSIPVELATTDPKYLGLSGITAFTSYLRQILSIHTTMPLNNDFLDLSRHLMSVGNSRYWFHKLIEQHQRDLFSIDVPIDLGKQFDDLVVLWRGIGLMLGTSVHTDKLEKVESVVLYLENIHEKEKRLFSYLLSLLPNYEEGMI